MTRGYGSEVGSVYSRSLSKGLSDRSLSIDDLDSDAGKSSARSSVFGMSVRSGFGGRDNDGPPTEIQVVGAKAQRVVSFSKIIMIGVLVIAVTGLATATYLFVQHKEQQDFERTFESYASEIIAVSTENVNNAFGTIATFSDTVTSLVSASGQTWPNVTIADFQQRAANAAKLIGGVKGFTFATLAENREQYEAYAQDHIYDQVQDALEYIESNMTSHQLLGKVFPNETVKITFMNMSAKPPRRAPESGEGPYMANWQRWPWLTKKLFVMNNMLRVPTLRSTITAANMTKMPAFGFFEGVFGVDSQIIQPIFRELPRTKSGAATTEASKEMVGIIFVFMDWGRFWKNLLPEGSRGITMVMKSSCGFEISYYIDGLDAVFLGLSDFHDPEYEEYEISQHFYSALSDTDQTDYDLPDGVCIDKLTIHLYPTKELEEDSYTNAPIIYSIVVVCIFVFTALVFMIYDWAVASRQRQVMNRINTQHKIVANIFPKSIQDRLYAVGDAAYKGNGHDDSSVSQSTLATSTKSVGNYLGHDVPDMFGKKPIADLFLETTVLFADISGFTAWSSSREPSQVFLLLEYIYGAFDKLAKSHRVFKVETVGDCYVAVTGLPDPDPKHALAMCKFARNAMDRMRSLTNKLEVTLGPDTGDLEMRMGLHSGQVTAGVLRGERSRFQLFGDTVNVAARMESTSRASKIQLSAATAKLLMDSGKGDILQERSEKINVNGKGKLQTYWLETKKETRRREAAPEESATEDIMDLMPDFSEMQNDETLSKMERLVAWNTEVFCDLVRQIVAARKETAPVDLHMAEQSLVKGHYVLDEFKEIISLPKITSEDLRDRKDINSVELEQKVIIQIHDFISKIAATYNSNAFHDFAHASHVTQSVAKLLSRIVSDDDTNQTSAPKDLELVDQAGHSYGITSDPLTQFAVVFSALIHDAEHPGVTNAQLINENDPWAKHFRGKSMAEQNSVNIAWAILQRDTYEDFRRCIYSNEEELKRFRQLVVNTVMATDICDKEFNALRKARWAKAFSDETKDEEPHDLYIDRKATIVIEHLIQASDVCHTMQHWQMYLQWNRRFFFECYGAYRNGRGQTDPSVGWYKGEIGFFDFYIIPLAKKLDSCGVFGVSSHEYLNYAQANREQWERDGESVVAQYLKEYNEKHGPEEVYRDEPSSRSEDEIEHVDC